jgi:streptogramin lyase
MKFYQYNLSVILFFELCLLVTMNTPVNAQEQNDIDLSRLEHIGMEQGLSSNKVNCIFQDKKGFMWFGTDYGLNRYDGYSFKVFTKIKDDSLSLTDNDIKCITQDATGNIWIGIESGLYVMDYKTEKITRFVSKDRSDSIWKYNINITALAADDSSVWMGTEGHGIIQYKIYRQELKIYEKPVNEADPHTNNFSLINNLIIENNGNILAGMGIHSSFPGLFELNVKKGVLIRISLERKIVKQKNNFIEYTSNDLIKTLYKDANGNIYIGTLEGAYLNTFKSDSSEKVYTKEDYFQGKSFFRSIADTGFKEIEINKRDGYSGGLTKGTLFLEYKPGKIFFCNTRSSGIFDLKNSEAQSLNSKSIHYPKGIAIEKLFKDRSGKLWFITSTGIETLEPLPFQHEVFSLNGTELNSIIEDNEGIFWLGTNKRCLVSLDIKKSTTNTYKINNQKESGFHVNISPTTGTIYGTVGFDPYEFNKNEKSFRKITDLRRLVDPHVKDFSWNDLYCTSDGTLWVNVHQKGIAKLDPQTGQVRYVVPEDTIHSTSRSNENPYFDDGKQNFYLGATTQIIQVNYRTYSYKVYDIEKAGLGNIENGITSVTKDNAGNLWLGNRNQGLTAFNIKSQKIYNFTVKDGLPTNQTSRILFVNGVIWVDHQNGIYKFIPPKDLDNKTQKPTIKTYGVKDGLPNIDFSADEMITCRDGKILFAADSKLISFYPDSIQSNEYVPPVVITALQVNNNTIEAGDSTKILLNNISSTDTIHLDHFQNSLSFEYAALNYVHSEDNEYAYKMDGIDTAWIYCDKRRFVTYSNLRPGEYTFHIKGSNNNGIWSEEGIKLTIIILPPWWKTWWFYLAEAIATIAIVYWIVRLYIARTLAIEFEKLKAVSIERERIASDMHDDLGAGLTSIRLLSEVANLKAGKDIVAKSEIEKIVKSTNNLSENLREIIWTMNTRFDKLEDFIIYIRTYSVEFFDNSGIKFQFNRPVIIPDMQMSGELRRNLFLCIKEALNNIVKHSRATEAALSLDVVNEVLFIEIKDNGVGIDSDQINKFGNGLKSMKERLIKCGSELKIEVNNGTTLKFEINVQK